MKPQVVFAATVAKNNANVAITPVKLFSICLNSFFIMHLAKFDIFVSDVITKKRYLCGDMAKTTVLMAKKEGHHTGSLQGEYVLLFMASIKTQSL